MKKILVTGGAGFIGSALCGRLLAAGHAVTALDNLYTGRLQNIAPYQGNPAFTFIKGDVMEPIDLEVDYLFNLASAASPVHYQHRPTKTFKTNILGAINMLDLATKYGATVMQFSTSEIYGDPEVHPQPESYRGNVNPIGIRACYDEAKRGSETLCFDYHREFGTRVKVIRIFNTYGPGMNPEDGRVVSNFIVQALRGQDITVYGDGLQTRSFCHVDDLVEGILRMMFSSPEDFLGPVNLGNPGEFTMLELAEKVIAATGSQSKIIHEPLPADDPTQRKPVIELAKEKLGWQPTISLDEGLVSTIAYFKDQLANS